MRSLCCRPRLECRCRCPKTYDRAPGRRSARCSEFRSETLARLSAVRIEANRGIEELTHTHVNRFHLREDVGCRRRDHRRSPVIEQSHYSQAHEACERGSPTKTAPGQLTYHRITPPESPSQKHTRTVGAACPSPDRVIFSSTCSQCSDPRELTSSVGSRTSHSNSWRRAARTFQ